MNMASEAPPKKQVSERRRKQNKQAQKNYRERQKRNLQVLQDIAGSSTGFLLDSATSSGATLQPDQGISTNTLGQLDAVDDALLTGRTLRGSLNPDGAELSRSGLIRENLQSHAYPLATPNSTPSSSFPATLDCSSLRTPNEKRLYGCNASTLRQRAIPAVLLSPESLLEDGFKGHLLGPKEDALEEVRKNFSVEEIMKAGLKALAHNKSYHNSHDMPEEENNNPQLRTDRILVIQNATQEPSLSLPDIHKNNIRIKQVLFTAACVTNATVLGLGFEASSCDYEISPFFRESISEEAAKEICKTSFGGLKEHLRPSISQVMRAHHPYIDVLPFPTFRERVIKLAYAEEPMIDEDDLCNDLENDGLICWGSSLGGGNAATGSGAPWDIRSWEAQPWFLKKWWILIGGADGEIYKQTRWWCEMRGEKACYPW